jgi:hypothetical protein
MNGHCKPICSERLSTKDQVIKEVLLALLAHFGVRTNSKIAFVVPGWANDILCDSICYGPALRKTAIAYYLAHLCDFLSGLNESQKRALERDVSPIRNESFAAVVENGKNKCGSTDSADASVLAAAG